MYRLSAVHCQVTRYSQRVPGYLTRYSRCQPMKSLLTKNQPIRVRLWTDVRLGKTLFSPSTWWLQQAFLKAQLEYYSNYDIWIWFIFQMPLIWPKKCKFVSLICWLKQTESLSTSKSESKQTWFPWCLMPIGTIQHLNTQSTVLTNNSVLVASVVYG